MLDGVSSGGYEVFVLLHCLIERPIRLVFITDARVLEKTSADRFHIINMLCCCVQRKLDVIDDFQQHFTNVVLRIVSVWGIEIRLYPPTQASQFVSYSRNRNVVDPQG